MQWQLSSGKQFAWRRSESHAIGGFQALCVAALLAAAVQPAAAILPPIIGTCSGEPTACNQLAAALIALCPVQTGCHVVDHKDGVDSCAGTATPCSTSLQPVPCEGRAGCHWNDYSSAPSQAPTPTSQAGQVAPTGLVGGFRTQDLLVGIILTAALLALVFIGFVVGVCFCSRRHRRRAEEVEARRTAGAAIGIPATPMVITCDISGPYASPLLTAAAVTAAIPSAIPRAGPVNPNANPRIELPLPVSTINAEGVPVVVSEQNNSGFYAVHWVPKPVQPGSPAASLSPSPSSRGGALGRLSGLLRRSAGPSEGSAHSTGQVRTDGSLHGAADGEGSAAVGVSRRWVVTPEEGVALAVPRDLVTQGIPAAVSMRGTLWHRLLLRRSHPPDPPSVTASTLPAGVASGVPADATAAAGDIEMPGMQVTDSGGGGAGAAASADCF